jgi:hypothetical protein
MPKLSNTLKAWGSTAFAQTLKEELEALAPGELPLDQGSASGYVDTNGVVATVLSVTETDAYLRANIGLFFHEVLAGCSCGDDPALTSSYCQIRVSIDKVSAEAEFAVI